MNRPTSRLIILSGIIYFISNLHIPVLASHFVNLNLPKYFFGISHSLAMLLMFLMLPTWTSLAEEGYRTLIINVATVFFAIGQISLGYLRSPLGILALRGLSSLASTGFQVGLISLVLGLGPEDQRLDIMKRYMLLVTSSGLLGTLFGGFLGFLRPSQVFYIQGILMLGLSIVIKFLLDPGLELVVDAKRPKFFWESVKEGRTIRGFFDLGTRHFLCLVFLTALSFSIFNISFNYYLAQAWGFKPWVNGSFKFLAGILGLVLNLGLVFKNEKYRASLEKLLWLMGLGFVFGLLTYLTGTYLFLVYGLVYFSSYSVLSLGLEGFLTGKSRKGELLAGIFNGFNYLGEILGGLMAGWAYFKEPKLPFLLGSLGMLVGLSLGLKLYIRRYKKA